MGTYLEINITHETRSSFVRTLETKEGFASIIGRSGGVRGRVEVEDGSEDRFDRSVGKIECTCRFESAGGEQEKGINSRRSANSIEACESIARSTNLRFPSLRCTKFLLEKWDSPRSLIHHTPHDDRYLTKRAPHNPITRSHIQPTSLPVSLECRIPREHPRFTSRGPLVARRLVKENFGSLHKTGEGEGAETLQEELVGGWGARGGGGEVNGGGTAGGGGERVESSSCCVVREGNRERGGCSGEHECWEGQLN